MGKVSSAAVFISMFLFSTVAGILLVGLAAANPMSRPPDMYTEPPTVTILGTVVNGSNVSISFKANVGESTTAEHTRLNRVYYTVDWDQNVSYVYEYYNVAKNFFDSEKRSEFSYRLNVTGIPDGNRTVTVYAEEYGYYESGVGFYATGFSNVSFTVDTSPPDVSFLSLKGVTYRSADVPLNFTVSESASKIEYVLDDDDAVMVEGNVTLAGLSAGVHNITVYVWDAAGNVGASETVTFMVEPFPVVPVATASVTVVAVSTGILVYFKKRKH